MIITCKFCMKTFDVYNTGLNMIGFCPKCIKAAIGVSSWKSVAIMGILCKD